MAKKVFCKECVNRMSWSIPNTITKDNYEYAKHYLSILRGTCICSETMKTKNIDNQQYCNKFRDSEQIGDRILTGIENYELQLKDADELEQKIKEYEKINGINSDSKKNVPTHCVHIFEEESEKVIETGYIIVDEEHHTYYNGNQFKLDIRDCKIYHTEKRANTTIRDISGNRKPVVKKITITIE